MITFLSMTDNIHSRDYSRAENFLSPSDTVAVLSHVLVVMPMGTNPSGQTNARHIAITCSVQ